LARFDVTIAGELNLDLILYGLPGDLPAERELLADDMMLTLGSSSAIVAHNLAALGAKVGFVSCIGDDQLGQMALDRLSAVGVDVSKVIRLGDAKTGVTVILHREEGRKILTYPGTIFDLTLERLDLGYLSSARHFHLSSLFLQRGLRPRVSELLQELKAAGLTVSLDCNDDPDDKWEGLTDVLRDVDVFMPNARELKKAAGTEDLQRAVERVAAMVPLLVVKLGPRGALARRGSEEVLSAAFPVEAVDPVGAGDSFDAGFLCEFLRGADLRTSLDAGNLAGALSVTRAGGTEAFRDAAYRESFLRSRRVPSAV